MKDIDSKSRRAILEASAKVLASDPGASMSRIATLAEVGRATLYRHFPSRDALIRALALHSIREIDALTAPIEQRASSVRHALELVFEAIVPLGERYHFLMREVGLEKDPEVAAELARQARETEELIDAAKAEGCIDAAVPTAWVAKALDALIYASWEVVNEGTVAQRDAPSLAFHTFLDGLAPRAKETLP